MPLAWPVRATEMPMGWGLWSPESVLQIPKGCRECQKREEEFRPEVACRLREFRWAERRGLTTGHQDAACCRQVVSDRPRGCCRRAALNWQQEWFLLPMSPVDEPREFQMAHCRWRPGFPSTGPVPRWQAALHPLQAKAWRRADSAGDVPAYQSAQMGSRQVIP